MRRKYDVGCESRDAMVGVSQGVRRCCGACFEMQVK